MAQGLDEVENAIHSIRRIGRLSDLEQVQAILSAKRVELLTRSSRRQGPDGKSVGGKSVPAAATKPPAKARKGKLQESTLDPAHRQDPAYIEYCNANDALTRYCAEHKVPRTRADPAIRDAFMRALATWAAAKQKYKISGLAHPTPLNAGANGAAQAPAAGGDGTAQSGGSP